MQKEKLYQKILQVMFFLALISPLIVDRRLFFPYTTSSALFFRLIAEALFFSWLIFILIYPKFRPKLNILIGAASVYLLALLAATIFSVNPYLSFWGDAERMMGFFNVSHYFVLFLIGASIFRDKNELKTLLKVFVGIGFVVAVYGILQRFGLTNIKPGELRIVSTVGNAAVLAAYLIFGLFFSLFLFLKEKDIRQKMFFGISVLIYLAAIFLTGTRGAYLGVMVGLLWAFLVIIWGLKDNKKLQKKLVAGLILAVMTYGTLFICQNQPLVKNNQYLYRLTHFSLSDTTAKTRFMSWGWGFKSFIDKPLLGYGFENFAISYNKNFESRYYDLAAKNPYFDRAHNIVVELLVTTGVIGLAAYLLFLAAIAWCLIKAWRREGDYIYFGIFSGLLSAYFIQNLLLFDILPAMLGFMVFLVFVNNKEEKIIEDSGRSLPIYFTLPLALIFLSVFVYYSVNKLTIKPYRALKDNVAGQIMMPEDHDSGIAYLSRSVSYNTVLDLDLRTSSANTILNYYFEDGGQSDRIKEDLDFAISLYKENLKYLPDDTYYNYKIAEIMDFRFSLDLDEKIISEARSYIDKAISTSPGRARLYYILTENLFMSGELEKGVENAEYAVSLNDSFAESYWELTKAYYIVQNFDKAKENLIKTINLGHKISENNLINLMHLFNTNESSENQIEFYELVIKNGTDNYLFYSTLANLYYEAGNKEKAIERALQSAEMNPATQEKVEKFIQKVEEKINN